MKREKLRKKIITIIIYGILSLIMIFYLAPFLWMLLSSFQLQQNLTKIPPEINFRTWQYNYGVLLKSEKFLLSLRNTIIVSTVTTLLTLLFSGMGAYVLARFKFKGKALIMFSNYSIQMGPAVAFLIPLFLIMRSIRLIDTLLGFILSLLVFTLPVSMWILLGFFKSIPKEMEEAGYIDGCKRLGVLLKIILPMSRSGIISAGIVTFISVWGELLISLPITITKSIPLTVFASSFSGIYFTDYGGASASAVLSSIPTVIMTIVFRNYLIKGLLEGAIKG